MVRSWSFTISVVVKNNNIFGKAYASEAGRKDAPIAKFHERHVFFGRRNAYLELFPGYEGTLDTLVCMCRFHYVAHLEVLICYVEYSDILVCRMETQRVSEFCGCSCICISICICRGRGSRRRELLRSVQIVQIKPVNLKPRDSLL